MRAGDLLDRIAPEQRLLLRSVLAPGAVAGDAFGEWRGRVDIDDLDHESNRLLPLLARRIDELAPTDPVRARVRGVYRHAWVRNQLIVRDAAKLAAGLRERDVPVMVLKGTALLRHYGNDMGSRPMFDVDLLVPLGQLDTALAVLAQDGWRPRAGVSAAWLRTRVVHRRHSFPISRDLDKQLDLHWHVLGGSLGPGADDRFWADAEPFDLDGIDVLSLRPADLLLHVLVHGARSSERGYLQWIADAVHVAREADSASLADGLAAAARQHGVVSTVRAALEAIERTVDEPRLQPVLDRVANTRPTVFERAATTGRVAGALLQQGGGGEGVLTRARGATRAWLDLDLAARPALYTAYVAAGRRARIAGALRRVAGPLARTPLALPPPARAADGLDLDFHDPATSDHHAGPGWWIVDERGLRSHGPEARIVIELPTHAGAIDLELDVRSADGRSRRVELRANERVVAHLDVGPEHLDTVRVEVPAEVARRFRPLELAFLAGGGRGRVGITLLRLRVGPASVDEH